MNSLVHPLGSLTGLQLVKDGVPSTTECLPSFQHYIEVYERNKAGDYFYHSTYTKKAVETLRTKLNDGVLSVSRDRTNQVTALQAIQHQKAILDNILKYSPTGITVTEAVQNEADEIINWKTILANDASETFTGFTKEVLLSKTIGEIDPSLLTSDTVAIIAKRTLETGTPFTEHVYIQPTDKWLEISVAKMDDNHLLNLFTDITTTKKVQLQISHAAERLKAVFDASQSGMFTFEPVYDKEELVDFRFVITNKRFAAYVGQTPLVLQGALGSQWFPGYLTNGVFDMYKHTFLTGETQRKDIHYHVDGHDLYLDLMSTKVGAEVLVTFNDYTPLKTAQLQLEKNIEELRRSNANLEEFAYAASHDLKEPIRKVHFFADTLKELLGSRLTEQEAKLFNRMQLAAQRMAMLIDDLLTYSHVSRGIDMVEDIDLSQQLRVVLNDLELIIQEKKAVVTVGNLPKITGHRHQIEQLFQNLISNALKYSKANELPKIDITYSQVDYKDASNLMAMQNPARQYYAIEVKDNGIGFEQKDAERIFNVFQRLHGNHEFSGTGVGLSIARKVAENHKGAIIASSQPQKGSVFIVYLPVE